MLMSAKDLNITQGRYNGTTVHFMKNANMPTICIIRTGNSLKEFCSCFWMSCHLNSFVFI